MKFIKYYMAQSKSSKRTCSSLDTDSDSDNVDSAFPHFIVLESLEEKPLSKVNPFVVEKVISGVVKPVSVKKLYNGTLLVEVEKRTYAENLLGMKFFHNLKIKAYAHPSLNISKGVVRSSELSLCTVDELKSYLKNQKVTDVKRISIKKDNQTIETNTYILTFNKPQIPKEIKVGYSVIKVNPYIPNPLRCYNCQKFGHHEQKCTRQAVCRRCAESGSDHVEHSCNRPPKCANCGGDHPADSRSCTTWKFEKEVNTTKYTKNISFSEARKSVQNSNTFPTKSYSQATKQNISQDQTHPCQSCHSLLKKLVSLTPESLPNFIESAKSSLQVQTKQVNSTTTSSTTSPESSSQDTTPRSQVRPLTKSPVRGARQSHAPRPKVQLETTNSKNRFSALMGREEEMECGERPPSPSPTRGHSSRDSSHSPPKHQLESTNSKNRKSSGSHRSKASK